MDAFEVKGLQRGRKERPNRVIKPGEGPVIHLRTLIFVHFVGIFQVFGGRTKGYVHRIGGDPDQDNSNRNNQSLCRDHGVEILRSLFYNIRIVKFPSQRQPMAIRTWLGDRLKPLNSEYGKASPGWGTTPVMGALIVLFGLFLIIIIQLFNGSLVIDGFKTTPW